MKAVLDPLGSVPGVRSALLSTLDGVPIAWSGRTNGEEEAGALSALVAGWVDEVARSVTPLSWSAPQRLVLRASRGTIVVAQTPRALLIVALEAGMSAEDVQLPMESALARLQRNQRPSAPQEKRSVAAADVAQVQNPDQVPGIFPAHNPVSSLESGVRPSSA